MMLPKVVAEQQGVALVSPTVDANVDIDPAALIRLAEEDFAPLPGIGRQARNVMIANDVRLQSPRLTSNGATLSSAGSPATVTCTSMTSLAGRSGTEVEPM